MNSCASDNNIILTQVDANWIVFVPKNANIHETDLENELGFTKNDTGFEKTYKSNAEAQGEIKYILNQLLLLFTV